MNKIYYYLRKPAYTIIVLPTLLLTLASIYILGILQSAMEDSAKLNRVTKILIDSALICITLCISTLFFITLTNLIQFLIKLINLVQYITT